MTLAAFVAVASVDDRRKTQKKKKVDVIRYVLEGGTGQLPAYLGHSYLEVQAGGGGAPLYLEPSKNIYHARLRCRALWCERDGNIVLVVCGV